MSAKVFSSEGILLQKQGLGEASLSVLILTEHFGLVRLRAQSARVMTAKMRSALEPMTLGTYSFVRGVHANRLIGASAEQILLDTKDLTVRRVLGQITRLLLRLLPGEEADPELFGAVREGFRSMSLHDPHDAPDIECMIVLSILAKLGYLSEDVTLTQFVGEPPTPARIAQMRTLRPKAIRAINQMLSITGL